MSLLTDLLGDLPIKRALRGGAAIIDVRPGTEYNLNRIPGSYNIPIGEVAGNIERIKALSQPIIFCCANGSRAAIAVRMMKNHSFKACNGGNWEKLQQKI